MFESLFGADTPLAVRFLIAFIIVLLLIGATFWLIRRFGTDRLGAGPTRGRQPRLAVIDAAAVDGRRRLVLIRRDNVEHLLMIGGPSDIVIEQNIVRAVPVTPREMPAPARAPADAVARTPEPVPMWPVHEPAGRPVPEPAMRPSAEAAMRPPRDSDQPAWPPPPALAPEPPPRPQRRPLAPEPILGTEMPEPELRPLRPQIPPDARRPPVPGEARVLRPPEPARPSEPIPRPEPPQPLSEVEAPTAHQETPIAPQMRPELEPMQSEPARRRAPETQEFRPSPPTADADLADMAQRLEAALRRPFGAGGEVRPPGPAKAPPPDAAPRSAAPAPAPAPTPERPPAEPASEPSTEAARPPEASGPPAPEPKPARPEAKPAPAKTVFDSLEEEMASLLGRPKSKE